jgi:hypothetical protein
MYILRHPTDPLVWRLVVDRGDPLRRRPGVRIEAAVHAEKPWRPVQVLRVVAHAETIFWAQREEPWATYANFVRGMLPARATALPAVTLAAFRGCTAEADSSAWWLYWMRHFADALAQAPEGVLIHGVYDLRPARSKPALTTAAFTHRPAPDSLADIELTRQPSPPDDDRVTMWRKHAAQGIPPGLTYDWVCEPGPLLVDGHDRMFASLLEGRPARALRLTPVAHGGEKRRLAGTMAFGDTVADELYPFGRVVPLPGGVPAWKREASDRLWLVRDSMSPRRAERMLEGLESVVPA